MNTPVKPIEDWELKHTIEENFVPSYDFGNLNQELGDLTEQINKLIAQKVRSSTAPRLSVEGACAGAIKELSQCQWQSPWMQYLMETYAMKAIRQGIVCQSTLTGGPRQGLRCDNPVLPGHRACNLCESFEAAHQELQMVLDGMIQKTL